MKVNIYVVCEYVLFNRDIYMEMKCHYCHFVRQDFNNHNLFNSVLTSCCLYCKILVGKCAIYGPRRPVSISIDILAATGMLFGVK